MVIVRRSARQVLVILDWLQRNWNFFNRFSTSLQISNFINTRPVGTELLHADRRTDMTKQTVASHYFSKVPKKLIKIILIWNPPKFNDTL